MGGPDEFELPETPFVVVKIIAGVDSADVELSSTQLIADIALHWNREGGVHVQDESALSWQIMASSEEDALDQLVSQIVNAYWTVTKHELNDKVLVVSSPKSGLQMNLTVK